MYNFKKIEKKWQKYWDDNKTFKTDIRDFSKPKFYALDMFPYPSGVGLHAGHPEGYTASDIIARMKRMQGFNVLHPMGFDSFGLPAEQYAINTGNHPEKFTKKNTDTFRTQLKMLGFSYDWDREISTTDPSFYKWTQWIFKQLYEDGLAKNVLMPVNYCEELGCVLANDEVIDGKSERGGYPVIRKNMKQWVIDLPKYAEKLLEGLNHIEWPTSTKEIQKNWIGKSTGAEVIFKVANTNKSFTVFTTRVDTLFGVTYCVLSPEHPLVNEITSKEKAKEVNAYQKICASKSDLERTELNKEKTGVYIGADAINPVNGKKIPIWISDYVLANYGTGAIMAVPAHDERDYDFAVKFNIPIIQVLGKSFNGKNESTIRSDKKLTNRTVVNVIVKHPDKEEYLVSKNNNFNWTVYVMGGIEEGETPIEAAKRELAEETGYCDIKNFKEMEFIYFDNFYARHKDVNRHLECHTVILELNSLKQKEVSEEEKAGIELMWIPKNQLLNTITTAAHLYDTERLLKGECAYTEDGVHLNSEFLNNMGKEEAINVMIEWLEKNKCGIKKINYKVREWIFARQRYWGEPIPIIHLDNGKDISLKDKELPLILPALDDYRPTKDGSSPLERNKEWVNIEIDGMKGKRETSTMPGSAGSSWYFLRYIDPRNEEAFADQELLKHWMPVDLYIGGPEHAVGHLLYSRMWNNYLYDKGLSPVSEPFKKLVHQGMILGANGLKMGKRFPEYVVDPNKVVESYGADTLRLYEMFMGPLEADKPWNNTAMIGANKFLNRVWTLFETKQIINTPNKNLDKIYHQTVKKVTNDYENLSLNTAISQMMIFTNSVSKEEIFPKEYAEGFIKLLNPIAPFITEELWEMLGHNETIAYEKWPTYDESKTIEETVEIGIQVNGKLRGSLSISIDLDEEKIKKMALEEDNVKRHLQGKEIIKIIVIKNKIVNIVIKKED